MVKWSVKAREITRWNRGFKIEIKMADETFSRDRSFVIIISRSANWFIRFNRGGGRGRVTKRPQDSQSSDLIVYLSRRIRKYPSILESKTERRQAFGGSLVTTSRRESVAAIKFMAESNCRVDFASKVIDQSSLVSISLFAFDFFSLFFFFWSN